MTRDACGRHRLVCPLPLFRRLLAALARRDANDGLRLQLGYRRHEQGCDWLVQRLLRAEDVTSADTRMLLAVEPGLPHNVHRFVTGRGRGVLFYRLNRRRLRLWGYIHEDSSQTPLSALLLVGPGMQEIALEAGYG